MAGALRDENGNELENFNRFRFRILLQKIGEGAEKIRNKSEIEIYRLSKWAETGKFTEIHYFLVSIHLI